ncbi:MAG: hypothetical protein Q7S03_00350 [bacterium]|nr:hypothetical protein [bacterium]
MRKIKVVSLLFTVLLISFFTLLISRVPIFAQTQTPGFDFSKAYQDYIYNYNLYRDSHISYESAKGEYRNYQTLSAQTKALEATRDMLRKRDEVLRTYFTALRMKLVESTGVTNYDQSVSFLRLDTEVNWLAVHKDSLSSPSTLEDLVKSSQAVEGKNINFELLSYQSLGLILSGKENALREKINSQTDKIDTELEIMKKDGENVDKLQWWLIEAKKKINLSKDKQAAAETKINSLKDASYINNRQATYNKAQLLYEESNQYLKEGLNFLSEITDSIKYE